MSYFNRRSSLKFPVINIEEISFKDILNGRNILQKFCKTRKYHVNVVKLVKLFFIVKIYINIININC